MGYASYHEDIIDRLGDIPAQPGRYPDATNWYGRPLPSITQATSKPAPIRPLTIYIGTARPKDRATRITSVWVRCACGMSVRLYKRYCSYCARSLRTGRRVLWWGKPR